ncbi:MAG: hypothetical protein Q7V31_02545 [Parvibaculum sp.]|nr:hypothetical protein [Parvibaculum sp.]MDO8837780.1 hypothetical protein [Parvibaculum sp.]
MADDLSAAAACAADRAASAPAASAAFGVFLDAARFATPPCFVVLALAG